MAGLPPELTSAALATLGVGGTWFASWLARKGKREDTKISQANQSFAQLQAVADERAKDNERLTAALAAAVADNERLRVAWLARWERQKVRCRTVTEPLLRAIDALTKLAGPEMSAEVSGVVQVLQEHRQDDHDSSTD